MKNAMKKLMAFALVAVMLIGALPFGANAAEGDNWNLTICVDGSPELSKTTQASKNPAETITVGTCLSYAQQHLGINPDLFQRAYVVVGGVGQDMYNTSDYFVITADTTVTFVMKPEPVYVTFEVDYGNGVEKEYTLAQGEKIGSTVLPADAAVYGSKTGFKFVNYTMGGAVKDASMNVSTSMSGKVIQGNWEQIGCTECGWATGTGHSNNCSKNPYNETQAPENQEPETQTPATGNAYLNIYVNGNRVTGTVHNDYTTYGAPSEAVSIAACMTVAGVASNNVTAVSLNGAPVAKNASFNLGAANSVTNVSLTVATNSTGSNTGSNNNSGSNNTGNDVNDYFGDEALSPVWLYIYTNDNLNHPTKMINITNYTITDDTITKKEVMTVIDDYYKASNSNNGIIWKGMYMEYDDSNTSSLDIYQWVYGNIGDAVYGVNEARTKGTVIIMARVTGVTTVSSAAADNSNPKTGDQIFAPVAIMAVSACALAAVAFYLNKKRAM